MKKFYFFFVLTILSGVNLQAQTKADTITMEEIIIVSKQNLKRTHIDVKSIRVENPVDAGEIFKDQSGFGIVKKGNYGMEPVLRGFKFDQLNVQFDGGTQSVNACPNRMDPAISQISPQDIEKIEVVKGPYDMRFPAFGGLINIVSKRPVYNPQKPYTTHIDMGYQSNGNNYYGNIYSSYAGKKLDFLVDAGYKNYGSYKSGNGTLIPSSFSRWGFTLKGGWNISDKQRLLLTFRQGKASDVLYAGLPMDADFDKSTIGSIDYSFANVSKTIQNIKIKLYGSRVNHEMSTRKRLSWKMVEAVAPVQAQVYGGRTEVKISTGKKNSLFAGVDFKEIAKQGNRYRKVIVNPCNGDSLPMPMTFTDEIWQNSVKNNLGIFVENLMEVSSNVAWITGIRLDRASYQIKDPAADFKAQYNDDIQPKTKVLPSLSSRINWYINRDWSFQWAVAMAQRSPDISEVFINHMSIGMDAYEYLGNPLLKAETNYQTDVRLEYNSKKFSLYGDVFYSYLNNYISARLDTSIQKKFLPCNPPFGTKVFTNIKQAFMTGFEAGADIGFMNNFRFSVSGAYTYAQNISLDEPLAEIPPFTVNSTVAYETSKVQTSIHGRFAAAQNRVSKTFAEITTPSFSVFDWYFTYTPAKSISINASVTNIFNLNYVEHLSRAYKNMGVETGNLYFEPGRSINVGLSIRM
ncbi:MAG: TonB-dependent receptor [Bacteroidales bacterium]|nr:TonB-dependent receptor [Bacteroidales bacterium]